MNWFLSHPWWQPLSRMTYCIYLTSLPIQFMLLYSTFRTQYYSHLLKVDHPCAKAATTVIIIIILIVVVMERGK